MLQETNLILELLCNSIKRNKKNIDIINNVNWSDMFSTACRNNIAPFLFDEIVKINNNTPIDPSIMQQWKQVTMYASLKEYRKNYALRQILSEIKKANKSGVIFKGPVLANLYPNYALRSSCDTDILIKESEKEEIFKIVEKLGYQRILISEDNVYTFESTEYGHRLELHTTIYGQHEGPRIDLLNAMDLTNPDSLIQVEACGIPVTTLGYEEQLIYLMFHMIKHFTLEGIALRHLIDIILYINAYIEKISLDNFWNAMKVLGYDSCCMVFFSASIRYMGLDSRILAGRKLVDSKVCDDLLMDIMNHGLNKMENKKIFQLWGIMEPYMVGSARKKQSAKRNYLTLLKPIDKRYEYARKYKILLPVCWVHKVGSYIHSKYILKKGIYTPLEKVKVAESRIQLLQEIGLIEKGD